MDSTGFSSPRTHSFPAGLRVLVVDDDPTWLKILEKMLKKCNYEVKTCNLARDALSLLREKKDEFDIVVSDVNMPDMDGFKLLEHLGLEMDLPVIMMSVDGETSRVMKGVQHGACDYLLKPIRMKELRNIWQHVFRKKMNEVKDIEEILRNGAVDRDESSCGEKRKEAYDHRTDVSSSSSATAKKARVVWTVDLHQRFVKAVNQIGFEKVGPKKILDMMGVPGLTRENIASHLQKYRLFLNRLQKENEMKAAFSGTKPAHNPDVCPQSSVTNMVVVPKTNEEVGQVDTTAPDCVDSIPWNIKLLEQTPADDIHTSLIFGMGSGLCVWNQDSNLHSPPDPEFHLSQHADIPAHLYDPLEEETEYSDDVAEYAVMGQGLYII